MDRANITVNNFTMILKWHIYEIQSTSDTLHGIKLRGRIRKFTIDNNITCLAENASDKDNTVRFALLNDINPDSVIEYIKMICPNASVTKVLDTVENPVLSKLKVNDTSRYLAV
jgi:hypothetical protein